MVCRLEKGYFLKNSNSNFNCQANLDDIIQAEMVFIFEATEAGHEVTVSCLFSTPIDGVQEYWSPTQYIYGYGTYTFLIDIPISEFGKGVYKIVSGRVFDVTADKFICGGL